MSEINVFCDFHHQSLLRSFVLLFENRLGMNLYRPIGMDWYYNKYWDLNGLEVTAHQFLNTSYLENIDGSRYVNDSISLENGVHIILDPGNTTTHKAIEFNTFIEKKFDFIIASVPSNIPLFQNLIREYQPNAKLIVQMGNNWGESFADGHNLLASIKDTGWKNTNAVYYHQEFDINIYKPIDEFGFNKISSYINVIENNRGWEDFVHLEKLLKPHGIDFKSYGGQCRDGGFNSGTTALSESMQKNDFIFHVKHGGDGYGHVLYNAYACGKPTIIRSSYYKDCLGEELFNDDNCIDLDKMGFDDAVNKIVDVINDIDQLKTMSGNAYRAFTNAVNFEQDAEKVKNWLANL